MRISFINSRETEIFKIPVRYFQIGDTFITFGDEVSEDSHVEFQNNRLVVSQKEDNTLLVNLIGHRVFLTKGDILHKGRNADGKVSALIRIPINEWALCYNEFSGDYTVFYFNPEGIQVEYGQDALIALSYFGLEFPIEVTVEGEGED